MKKFTKKGIGTAAIISSYIFSGLLLAICFQLDKKDKELTEKFYSDNAQELIDQNTYNKVVYIENYYDDYTTLEDDIEYTTGEHLYNCLVNSDLQCVKFDDKYYTLDGRTIYEYVIDNYLYVLDEDSFDYYNGVCRTYHSKTYDELKDYNVYLDVDENDATEYDGNTYYKTTRKLIKKQ
jgi:hypothetical protein